MKRPTMPLNVPSLTPVNEEGPRPVKVEGQRHRSANRLTGNILPFVGTILTILGALTITAVIVLVGRFDGRALLGAVAVIVGLAILFYEEETRWRA